MFFVIAAALSGGAAAIVLLHTQGWLLAILAAPVGGSLAAVVACLVLAWLRDPDPEESDGSVPIDEAIAALRSAGATESSSAPDKPDEHPKQRPGAA
ncbi:hypothetical protein [Methylobacterium sp. ID0610]|uniref:hypothetical protein n=1 Tax=Methylobacterium carpenticola TaxID=3344827 RepID=UPI0036953616